MSANAPLRSPLHEVHVAAGAVMAVDAGWEMPARYGEAQAEAAAARASAAVADVTHWGRIRIRGEASADLLARLCGPDVRGQDDDTVRPVAVSDPSGGLLCRARLARLEDMWLLLTPPAGRAKVLMAAEEACAGLDAGADDQTGKTAMLAVIGPQAAARLSAVLPIKVSEIADGSARAGSVLIARYIALRSDIGGLWRMEVILPNMLAGRAWQFITNKTEDGQIVPIGTEAMGMMLTEG